MLFNPDWDKDQTVIERWQQFLLDAADIIESRGHCHGTAEDAYGAVCMAGALSIAAYGKVDRSGRYDYKARRAVNHSWEMLWAMLDCNPVLWSDTHDQKEVCAALRAASQTGR